MEAGVGNALEQEDEEEEGEEEKDGNRPSGWSARGASDQNPLTLHSPPLGGSNGSGGGGGGIDQLNRHRYTRLSQAGRTRPTLQHNGVEGERMAQVGLRIKWTILRFTAYS